MFYTPNNKQQMNPLSKLEKNAALQILDYLYEKGEASRTEIETTVQGSSGTIGSSLVLLGEMGLLDERREPPMKRFIKLSTEGKQVAAHLNTIKQLLQK